MNMNLIDKDKLLSELNKKLEDSKNGDNAYWNGKADAYEMAIILTDEAEVIEERKHGYWVDETPVDGAEEVLSKWRCSICNCEAGTLKGEYPTWKACPNCTAIMDEVEE